MTATRIFRCSTAASARWGLGKGLPWKIYSTGGRFGYEDQAQTLNTQISTFEYKDGTQLVCETPASTRITKAGSPGVCTFMGPRAAFQSTRMAPTRFFWGATNSPNRTWARRSRSTTTGISSRQSGPETGRRRPRKSKRRIFVCAICHLGNIAYRLQRTLHFGAQTERYAETDRLLTRQYRKPFVVNENV